MPCSSFSKCTCQEILHRASSAAYALTPAVIQSQRISLLRSDVVCRLQRVQTVWPVSSWRASCLLLLLQLSSQTDLSSPPLLPLSSLCCSLCCRADLEEPHVSVVCVLIQSVCVLPLSCLPYLCVCMGMLACNCVCALFHPSLCFRPLLWGYFGELLLLLSSLS